ncbi:MAG: NifB/NifX family molybdenum-iron cluster-binding protein [Deltaproteobacteria bacterium]|nr:NifB/NifX family molybdenum-iron cluster-binding protein [Deltaproteobacteria bacterium]MBW1861957.1 NifB/NifX family molybdenum-iron cluster-binding protein [Deltaproteobacteria bacterium]
MRIAIPIWDDKISPVLDTASRLLIVDVEDQKEASRFETILDEQDLVRRCLRIRGMEVDTLICGAVSRPFFRMLMSPDIEIIPEISGHVEDVLKAYLQGNLFHSKFLMPGCRRNRQRQRKELRSFKKNCTRKEMRMRSGTD